MISLGTPLFKGNKKTAICPFSREDENRAKFLNVLHSEGADYNNQTG